MCIILTSLLQVSWLGPDNMPINPGPLAQIAVRPLGSHIAETLGSAMEKRYNFEAVLSLAVGNIYCA